MPHQTPTKSGSKGRSLKASLSPVLEDDISRSSRSVPSIRRVLGEIKRPSKARENEYDFTKASTSAIVPKATPRRSMALNRRTNDIVHPVRIHSITSRIGSIFPTKRPTIIVPEHPMARVMIAYPAPDLSIIPKKMAAGKKRTKKMKSKAKK